MKNTIDSNEPESKQDDITQLSQRTCINEAPLRTDVQNDGDNVMGYCTFVVEKNGCS